MTATSPRCRRFGVALLLIGSIACGDVLVTTIADENNGSLDRGLGSGTSLREAVLHAPEGSAIGFSPVLDGQSIVLTLGQIAIGKNLSISAASLAAGVTVSGNHASRVFNISASKTVTLTALDLVNGDVTGDGGAILNAGNLTLLDCELAGNAASDGGGAIENSGTLTLSACTLADNTAEVGGGAIEHASGTLTATNCTFSGNTAEFGGAIDGDGSSTIRLYSCTISGNHATDDGGGLEETSGTLLLENTIIAGNTAVDQGPDLKASSINTQGGVNLVSSTAGLGGSFSGIVANPNLAALGENGGRTRTMLPLAGSRAIDAAGASGLTADQRGLPRPVGSAPDIGAVELQSALPQDDDLSVAWIQRLPVLEYVPHSPNPDVEGWPAVGSTVTWRARVRNWSSSPRNGVAYRWRIDGITVASGSADLAADGYSSIDYPWPWTFERKTLLFELDPENTIAEFSEQNNTLQTWTNAITAGFWVEQSFYDYMHLYQSELPGLGSNGFEDWAQRQISRWNAAYEAAKHPVDAPCGVLDRVRLDKITIVPDGALPLNGGLPTNNPDNLDRTVDLVWGFPSAVYLHPHSLFHDHTTIRDSGKPFYYDGVLFHETSHARYLLDVYGANVQDDDDGGQILLTLNGEEVVGTPYMPRYSPTIVHYVDGLEEGSPFHGLMNITYTKVDRYSSMALNRIAGHRAVDGNFNQPGNAGVFLIGPSPDFPAQNTVQLVDGHGMPLAGAAVKLYRAVDSGIRYGKVFDDIVDANFTTDDNGIIEIGGNPFTAGEPLIVQTSVVILRADAAGKSGFGFLPAGLFNMEYWRGNTAHGHHELAIPMIGPDPEIVQVLAWLEDLTPDTPGSDTRKFRLVLGGSVPATGMNVTVDGHAANFSGGAWWVSMPNPTNLESEVVASWPGGPTLTETVALDPPPVVPQLYPQKVAGGLRVGWWSRAGYRYKLEHSENLFDWSPADSGTIHFGTGGWMEADDLVPSSSGRAFSRLQAERLTD